MDRNTDPAVDDLFAGLARIRDAEDKAPSPAPMSDTQSRSPTTPVAFSMGATFKLGARPSRAEDPLEEQARTAMIAAANAILRPWLNKSFPRIVEQQLGPLFKAHAEKLATALKQQVADEFNQRVVTLEEALATKVMRHVADSLSLRLEPAVTKYIASAENRISTALTQQVGDAVNQKLEPVVTKHVAAVERRLTTANLQQLIDTVNKRLEPVVSAQLGPVEDRLAAALSVRIADAVAAVEDRVATALNQRVADVVNQQLDPHKHVTEIEERIAATASRQVKDEVSRRLRRIADEN